MCKRERVKSKTWGTWEWGGARKHVSINLALSLKVWYLQGRNRSACLLYGQRMWDLTRWLSAYDYRNLERVCVKKKELNKNCWSRLWVRWARSGANRTLGECVQEVINWYEFYKHVYPHNLALLLEAWYIAQCWTFKIRSLYSLTFWLCPLKLDILACAWTFKIRSLLSLTKNLDRIKTGWISESEWS